MSAKGKPLSPKYILFFGYLLLTCLIIQYAPVSIAWGACGIGLAFVLIEVILTRMGALADTEYPPAGGNSPD